VAFGDSGIAERGSGGVYAEIRDLGDRIVAIGLWVTCGEESGVETTQPLAVVADLKNGKTIQVRA
jgi:hypothetical protein